MTSTRYEPDILDKGLYVVFCGINPASTAALEGHNFSNRSNRFWLVLHLAGFTDVRLAPHAWGSGILFAASIHVAMAAANCHILEVSQGYMPMMNELFNEPFDIRPDGTVHAPDKPGLGFTLRADALERFKYVEGPEYLF